MLDETQTRVALKSSPWKIIDLANHKREHLIHLPDLQRGFVWSPERVRALHDSLYKRYPVGALLLWKPLWHDGESPVKTRAWDIFPANKDTKEGHRVDEIVKPGSLFVLDGQQRLTSVFRIIFQSKLLGKINYDPELMVALSPEKQWSDEPFILKSRNIHREMQEGLIIPAQVL